LHEFAFLLSIYLLRAGELITTASFSPGVFVCDPLATLMLAGSGHIQTISTLEDGKELNIAGAHLPRQIA